MSTRAYDDLMFAWAHARLGDADCAARLCQDARAGLKSDDRVHEWLLSAFLHRVRMAVEGNAHAGEWPEGMLASLDHVVDDRSEFRNRRYVVDRMRSLSRVLEPDFRFNPWFPWQFYKESESIRRLIDSLQACEIGEFMSQFELTMNALTSDSRVCDRVGLVVTTARCGRRVPIAAAECVFQEAAWIVDHFLRNSPDWKYADEELSRLYVAVCDFAVCRAERAVLKAITDKRAGWFRQGGRSASRVTATLLFDSLLNSFYRVDMKNESASLLDLASEFQFECQPAQVGLDDVVTSLRIA